MKVSDIMQVAPRTCRPETDLAAAAMMMWDGDCGVLPVVGEDQKLRGIITDRDICIALASRHRKAEEMSVREVSNGRLYSCSTEDDLREAVKTMAEHQVRRLPVLDRKGKLAGILSMKDVLCAVKPKIGRKSAEIGANEVVAALQAIVRNHRGKARKKGSVAA